MAEQLSLKARAYRILHRRENPALSRNAEIYFASHEAWRETRAKYLKHGYPSDACWPEYDYLAQSTEQPGEAFQGFFTWHERTTHIPSETLEEATLRYQTEKDKYFGKGKVKVRLDPAVHPGRLDSRDRRVGKTFPGYAEGVYPIGAYISKA